MNSSTRGIVLGGMVLVVRLGLAIAIVAAACNAGEPPPALFPAPRLVLWTFDAPISDDELDAARAWEAIGFEVERLDDVTPARSCARDWYVSGDVACDVPIEIRRVDELAPGVLGHAVRELRLVELRADLGNPGLVLAHELGHIALDTGDHLAAGERGLMASSTAAVEPELTDADRALACRALAWCP